MAGVFGACLAVVEASPRLTRTPVHVAIVEHAQWMLFDLSMLCAEAILGHCYSALL
jgi:hypothetical protein